LGGFPGAFWGCLTSGKRSLGVLPSTENPDRTGPHEPRRASMRIMVRQGSRVRVPSSALSGVVLFTANSPVGRCTICPRLSPLSPDGGRHNPNKGTENGTMPSISAPPTTTMVRRGSRVRVPRRLGRNAAPAEAFGWSRGVSGRGTHAWLARQPRPALSSIAMSVGRPTVLLAKIREAGRERCA
jgi:hypothetical protein